MKLNIYLAVVKLNCEKDSWKNKNPRHTSRVFIVRKHLKVDLGKSLFADEKLLSENLIYIDLT